MNTFLLSGPHEKVVPGYDGICFVWFVGPHEVEVRFTATAVEVGEEGLSRRATEALLSKGESEMQEFLSWATPPEEIEFSTDNHPWVSGGDPE